MSTEAKNVARDIVSMTNFCRIACFCTDRRSESLQLGPSWGRLKHRPAGCPKKLGRAYPTAHPSHHNPYERPLDRLALLRIPTSSPGRYIISDINGRYERNAYRNSVHNEFLVGKGVQRSCVTVLRRHFTISEFWSQLHGIQLDPNKQGAFSLYTSKNFLFVSDCLPVYDHLLFEIFSSPSITLSHLVFHNASLLNLCEV